MSKTGCKSCGAPIFWRETKSGKLAPFNPPEDCPACAGDGCAACDGTGTRWTSHFTDCPDAATFRKR
ncbi:MAG: hypothetical protein ACYDA6_03070 [Solirubrobacteraceae bacterium]